VDERAGDDAVPSQPSFPKQEDAVLAYWATNRTFQTSIDARPAGKNGANEFVFYDGPPFANGLPHYGHLLTGYVKDLVPRYQTMLGRHVDAPLRLGLSRAARGNRN
jgi:isoleucyl-tRNA synthetase